MGIIDLLDKLLICFIFLIIFTSVAYASNFQIKSASLFYIGNVEGERYENITSPILEFPNKSFSPSSSLPYCDIIDKNITNEFKIRFEKRLRDWTGEPLAREFQVTPLVPQVKDVYSKCRWMNATYIEMSSNVGVFSFYFDGMWWQLGVKLFENKNVSLDELYEYLDNANRFHDIFFSGAGGDGIRQLNLIPQEKMVILNLWDYKGTFNCTLKNNYEYFNELNCPNDDKLLRPIITICQKNIGGGVRSLEDKWSNFHVIFDESFILLNPENYQHGCFVIYNDYEIIDGIPVSGWGDLLDLIDYLDFIRDNEIAIKNFTILKNRTHTILNHTNYLEQELNSIVTSSSSPDKTLLGVKVEQLKKVKNNFVILQKELTKVDNDIEKFDFYVNRFNSISLNSMELYYIVYKGKQNALPQEVASTKQLAMSVKNILNNQIQNINNEVEIEITDRGILISITAVFIALFSFLQAKQTQKTTNLVQMIAIELQNRSKFIDILEKYELRKNKKRKLSKLDSESLKNRALQFLNFYEALAYSINQNMLNENEVYRLWSEIIKKINYELSELVKEGNFEELEKLINRWRQKYNW